MNIYHYVYRITNIVLNKHYYGKRSSKKQPILDLGIKYFSSSTDSNFIKDQKKNSQNYKYKIIRIFTDSHSACVFESKLHYKFAVGVNPNFYNKTNQTANRFDSTGRVLVKSQNGEDYILISKEDFDPKIHITPAFGKVAVKDQNQKYYLVDKTDPRYLSKELIPIATGSKTSKETKELISIANSGKKRSDEMRQRSRNVRKINQTNVGEKNGRFKNFYHTPWGVFDSPAALEPEFTMTRMKHFCKKNHRPLTEKVWQNCEFIKKTIPYSDVGKTYKELGFWLIPI